MDVKQMASRLDLEEDEFYDVLELFVQTAPVDLMKPNDACNSRNPVLAEEAAHSLKGSSGSLGFMDISEQAQQIMVLAHGSRMKELTRSIPPFLVRLKALLGELRQILDNR